MGHIRELQKAFELTIEEHGRRVKCGPAPYHAVNTQFNSNEDVLTLRIEIPRTEIKMPPEAVKTVRDDFNKFEAHSLKEVLGEGSYYNSLIEATSQATQTFPSIVTEKFEESYCFKLTDKYAFVVVLIPVQET
jgi:hypothetical protein